MTNNSTHFAVIITGPKYINHFYKLGKRLKKNYGCSITYVAENAYEIYKEGYEELFDNEKTCYISDFTGQRTSDSIDWCSVFSSYDRISTYHYNFAPSQYEIFVHAVYCLWNHLFAIEKIDGIIYENVSNTLSYVGQLKCKEHGKKYIGSCAVGWLPGRRLTLCHDITGEERLRGNEIFNQNNSQFDPEIAVILNKIKEPNIQPSYMTKDNPGSVHYPLVRNYLSKIHLIYRYLKFCISEREQIKNSFINRNPFINAYKLMIRELRRRWQFRLLFSRNLFDEVGEDEKFLIFPLHFHPEKSTSVNSWFAVDEYPVIRSVAFAIPDGYQLYVKVHPNGFGFHDSGYYEKLKRIPRVKLIDYKINGKELIGKSAGVVTLTSTMGFEALVLEKPVFLFGNMFYKCHPYCFKVDNNEFLPERIKSGLELVNSKECAEKFHRYNLALIDQELRLSFPAHYEFLNETGEQNIDEIAKHIFSSSERVSLTR